VPFDPVLRDRRNEPDRRLAWMRDQYQHPEEHRHTIAEVQQWFHENDVVYLSTYPSALIGDRTRDLFAPAPDNWRIEGWLAQLGWIRSLGHEGGLFVKLVAGKEAWLTPAPCDRSIGRSSPETRRSWQPAEPTPCLTPEYFYLSPGPKSHPAEGDILFVGYIRWVQGL
jgi:hypothetical protein